MPTPPPFQRDLELLSRLLDQVIAEQAGGEAFAFVQQVRQLSKERRVGLLDAEERLVERLRSCSPEELRVAVRALSAFFDLANIAEDCQRIRVLRERERSAAPQPRPESVGDAVARLKQSGLTAERMQRLAEQLSIELVFTAHPTEAKRRTTRRLLRRLRIALKNLAQEQHLPREEQRELEEMLGDLTILWQIDLMRPQRPTVMQEVERGLFFFEGLWEIVPRIHRDLRRALEMFYPSLQYRFTPFLWFGSWIGGDRDGNPFVTADVTANTLSVLRRAALERHLSTCEELSRLLVMSDRQVPISEKLRRAVEEAEQQSETLRTSLETISPGELYRRWLKWIELRLEHALEAAGGAWLDATAEDSAPTYHHAEELEADVQLLADSIARHQGRRIVGCYLEDWLDQVRTFGLRFAKLDVRQDSRVHVDVLTEVFQRLNVAENYGELPETERQAILARLIAEPPQLPSDGLSDQTRETLALFRLLARTVRHCGMEPLGGHVISMTHHLSDMLAVLFFWKTAWQEQPEAHGSQSVGFPPYLPLVPLFETIDDLHRGPRVLEALFTNELYAAYLRSTGRKDVTQIVMVGYSDSTKDGGYLSAGWGLYRAQADLAKVAQRHGVRLVIFHGRGGALGRGGGPAARAILSLPPHSVGAALRMTEQGEVLAERYDDPQIAYRHLEQVTWATMLVSGEETPQPRSEWIETMNQLAERSYQHYRRLVDDPGFLGYFDQATPISEIERLPIASRPSRRRERRSLADLRAIPWTFAWTQCRQFIPAWYGLGTAIYSFMQERGDEWKLLQQMYDEWTFFRALIDNAVLALAKADLAIAQRYAELAREQEGGPRIWELIQREYAASRGCVLMITRQTTLLGDTPWLEHSIQERNPYVDPLNLIQIELTRRLRQHATDSPETDQLRELLRLTIQGVAAGLRTTG